MCPADGLTHNIALCCMSVCLAEIREAFRVLDRDGNGFISKQELGMAMRSLGYMPSEVELAIIMQRLDMDGKAP